MDNAGYKYELPTISDGESTKSNTEIAKSGKQSTATRTCLIVIGVCVATLVVVLAIAVPVVILSDGLCDDQPCLNNGICEAAGDNYYCQCIIGYTGYDCEIDIDECASDPCQNGGTCEDKENVYQCNCPQGFTGTTCEINIDDCGNDLCQNGATCLDDINDFTCVCTPAYTGDFCDNYLGEALVFAAIGDWGDTALPGQARVAEQMEIWGQAHHPQFVVTVGDNFYPNGLFSTNDPQINRKWLDMYVGDAIGDLHWYTVVGNHDYGNSGSGNEWNQVDLDPIQPRWHMPYLHYDFVMPVQGKDVHFIFFDTEGWRNSINNHTGQEEWFRNTLADSTADWKIVLGHRPIFSVGNYGPSSNSLRNFLNPLFEEYDVDMYLCGHDHNLQHIHQMPDPTNTYPDYIISGGGGALWYTYDEDAHKELNDVYGMDIGYFEMTWGFVGFTITADYMKMDYIDSDGSETYSLTRWHKGAV